MRKVILILLAVVFSTLLYSVTIQHVCPKTFIFNQDAQLMVEVVQGMSDIAEMTLHYRVVGDQHWLTEIVEQENEGSVYYKVTIPAKYLNTETVEYYFSIELNHGTVENFPAQDGTTPNYTLNPDFASGETSPGFVLLTDEPSVTADNGYLLVVSWFALVGEIDESSIEVWVGGKNVTSAAQISAPTIVYKETNPAPGDRKAIIRAQLGSKSIHSQVWTTQIMPGQGRVARPFNLRGNVNFASNYYDYSTAPAWGMVPENNATTWADLYATYGIMDIQTHIYKSSLEHSNKQPVDRYTLGLQLPFFDLFVGDNTPNISQLTLYGKNVRGIYSKLHNKHVALILSQGEAVRKTTSELDFDPLTAGIQPSGTFKQEAIGARLQFGNENGFMTGLNMSRHRDIISSLDSLYYMYNKIVDGQNQTVYTATAKDNAVLSYDLRINIPEQKTTVGGEIAGSLLNYNAIPGAITQADLETYTGEDIPFDPSEYSNLFVLNKNMEPFLPSRANLAWMGYMRTYFWNNLLGIQYAETGSAFNALGTYYQMQDSKALTFNDQFNLSRYFVLSGGLNWTEDNLMQHKSETNTSLSWNAQTLLQLPRLPYLKAAYFTSLGNNRVNSEITTTKIDKYERKSNSLSFGMGYNISQIRYVPTQLDISYRMGADNCDKTDTLDVVTPQTDNENSGLSLTMYNRFALIPLTLQFALSSNQQKELLTPLKNNNLNLLFGAGYSLWNSRIKPYLNYRTISLSGDQNKQHYGYFTLGVDTLPLKSLSLNTSVAFQEYSNQTSSNSDYDTFTWRMLLTQRF